MNIGARFGSFGAVEGVVEADAEDLPLESGVFEFDFDFDPPVEAVFGGFGESSGLGSSALFGSVFSATTGGLFLGLFLAFFFLAFFTAGFG